MLSRSRPTIQIRSAPAHPVFPCFHQSLPCPRTRCCRSIRQAWYSPVPSHQTLRRVLRLPFPHRTASKWRRPAHGSQSLSAEARSRKRPIKDRLQLPISPHSPRSCQHHLCQQILRVPQTAACHILYSLHTGTKLRPAVHG